MKGVRTHIGIILVMGFSLQLLADHPTAYPRVHIGVLISPDMNYRTLAPFQNNYVMARNEVDRPKLGFTAGLTVKIDIRKNLQLRTGLAYSREGERIPRNKYTLIPGTGPGGTPIPVNEEYSLAISYDFLELPVGINWIVQDQGPMRIYFALGLGAAYYLRTETVFRVWRGAQIINSDRDVRVDDVFAKLHAFAFFGGGVQYSLVYNLSLTAGVLFNHFITPLVRGTTVGHFPFSTGLGVGLSYQIGKH